MENYYLGNGRRWVFKTATNTEFVNVDNNASDKDIPLIIKRLLNQRGINSQNEIQSFLNPSLMDFHDPFLLDGMELAVDRIIKAISLNERILIYGDYDADGVSATSILFRFFSSLNLKPEFYIPDRVDEGYGISDIAVDYISDNDFDLVITVDCGISGRKQIEAIYEKCSLKGKPVDIIVTDHHQCNEELIPEALAILNPHLPGNKYPFKYLCGAGVALKLVHGLGIKLNKPKAFEEYLDIAAIATIADIVSLTGENRIIASFGIEKILSDPCVGIKALLKVSLPDASQIDSYRLSFILAPRINAAGRMGDAKVAVRLFTTENEAEAEKLAIQLNQSNLKRQEVQDEIYKEAVKIIESDKEYKNQKVLVVFNEGWHHGVIGIVASKLVDRYHKPAFVFSVEKGNESTLAVGSGRSIEGFNLFKAMEAQADILLKYGGHEQAGGLKILAKDLLAFRSRINEYANKHITDEMLTPELPINSEVKATEVNLKIARMISAMKPFGEGNPMPVFCFRGAVLLGKNAIGNGKHLKLSFDIGGQSVEGVYFGGGYLDDALVVGDRVDIVFTQEINAFRGKGALQLKLMDIRLTEAVLKRNKLLHKAAFSVECLDNDESWLYSDVTDSRNQRFRTSAESLKLEGLDDESNSRYIDVTGSRNQRFRTSAESMKLEGLDSESNSRYNCLVDKTLIFDDIVVNRDILAIIYKYIKQKISGVLSVADIFVNARKLEKETGVNINFFKLFVALLVFDELELIELSLEKDGLYRISLNTEAKKVDLENSEILDWVRETAASLE